jgi:hypothetical protein
MRCPRAADKWRRSGREAAPEAIILAPAAILPKANFFLADAASARRDKNKERA